MPFAQYQKGVITHPDKVADENRSQDVIDANREAGYSYHAPGKGVVDKTIFRDHDMAARLGDSDPKRRLPWFGPDMGVRMFTTARFMETWAHGQEIYDLKKLARTPTDRIKNVAAIGIRTFGWTFVNRKLEIPGDPPYVRLVAPSGEIWEWNEPSNDESIQGEAIDFCYVVTQGRNVADTALEVKGPVATQWMAIAQCFAGGPVDPPAPGSRVGA